MPQVICRQGPTGAHARLGFCIRKPLGLCQHPFAEAGAARVARPLPGLAVSGSVGADLPYQLYLHPHPAGAGAAGVARPQPGAHQPAAVAAATARPPAARLLRNLKRLVTVPQWRQPAAVSADAAWPPAAQLLTQRGAAEMQRRCNCATVSPVDSAMGEVMCILQPHSG